MKRYCTFLFLFVVIFSGVFLQANPLGNKGIKELVFIKRFAYDPNHYYTEFINSNFKGGGNICILNLETGKVRELFPSLEGGIFGRFDISFDAKKIVFSYKKSSEHGYRIYSANIDGSNLKQLTFPVADEEEIKQKYRYDKRYHHGTDDLDPCWLADGGIAFISTRMQYGVLCDPDDNLTVTLMYRMEADGSKMKRLSNGALSENSPCMLPDGRIMYTRWEYVDKGGSAVKCLWAMRPDGSGSAEIYGNDIALPVTMIFGRPIPETRGKFVFIGAPHYPQASIGTVIVADTSKDIRTREPMEYITANVDIRDESGFHFKDKEGKWVFDPTGKAGKLYRDPFPLSEKEFLVAMKPEGLEWKQADGYELALIDDKGNAKSIFKDSKYSAFQPFPLVARKTPPVLPSVVDETLAEKNMAALLITDVYAGLENVKRGDAKYIRVLEQVPRPWSANRRYLYGVEGKNLDRDGLGQQHVAISRLTHLGLKVQLGVANIEDDGSAYFLVPADRNIFLQVLDENYMALQTERTFVNYIPGEIRSCTGCHEKTSESVPNMRKPVIALRKAPQTLVAQRGEDSAIKLFDYEAEIQPIFDRHCTDCHGEYNAQASLSLSGKEQGLFNESYCNLVPNYERVKDAKKSIFTEGIKMTQMDARKWLYTDRGLVGEIIAEVFPKDGNVEYRPAGSFGARTSVLIGAFAPERAFIKDKSRATRAASLAETHKIVKLSDSEIISLSNWIDTNCQYYPTYWGIRDPKSKGKAGYRPKNMTYQHAISNVPPKFKE